MDFMQELLGLFLFGCFIIFVLFLGLIAQGNGECYECGDRLSEKRKLLTRKNKCYECEDNL
tara:strand:+ start:53768 stop:53950 length:183 start_codon:yes stop_codon:yes gene_type:complete